jgi:protein phosphatase 1 regulatory subunit 7
MSLFCSLFHLFEERSSVLTVKELHLQHLRLKNTSLEPLEINRFAHLKRLCLRQNELSSPLPEGAFDNLGELEELDMYDNRLGPVIEDAELKGLNSLT